ncbi:MAG: chemotaxis protein CheA [Gammaproteobacteria bacterium]
MAVDLTQFQQVFFEESFENIDVMETGLLNLDVGRADPEAINTIFRAAHSIKGGAGTFGFLSVSEFTHGVETLLDEMRSGKRLVERGVVDLLLAAVDCMRDMLRAARDGTEIDADRAASIRADIDALLRGQAAPAAAVVEAEVNETGASGWKISFRPRYHLFRTGNDPLRILRELSSLGPVRIDADCGRMPDFSDYIVDECYLGWEIDLAAAVPIEQVREIFEWVIDDCELEITPTALPAKPVEIVRAASELPAEQVPASAPATDGAEAHKPRSGTATPAGADSSIRVGIDKVDALINLVGELVITQSMLSEVGAQFEMHKLDRLRDGLAQLERNTRELQEQVMRIRMLPISFAFNRFPRLVRDLSLRLGKKVELKVSGEQTELDKTVMEKIGDPLVHLVRNAIDHGLESPRARLDAGKPESGTLFLNAFHEGGNIVIEVGDDGAGLDTDRILEIARARGVVGADDSLPPERIRELIFAPGFSTAKEVSDVSGRGVGLDVVVRNIRDLGGVVEIESERGRGTTFIIRLPLTLAILDGQLVRVGEEIYIIPIVSIVESLLARREFYSRMVGRGELYRLREEYVPIIRLHQAFNARPSNVDVDKGLLVVVEGDGRKAAIFVDDLLGQQQVVIKSLETNYRKVDGVSGATILGDGKVAMICDIPGLIKLARNAPGEPLAIASASKAA